MYGRRNGVRIFGIEESEGENTDKIVLDTVTDGRTDGRCDQLMLGLYHLTIYITKIWSSFYI